MMGGHRTRTRQNTVALPATWPPMGKRYIAMGDYASPAAEGRKPPPSAFLTVLALPGTV